MNQKKIGQLKTKMREQLKGTPYAFKAGRDDNYATIEEKEGHSRYKYNTTFIAHYLNGIMRISKDSNRYYTRDTDAHMLIIDYFIPLAELKEMDAIVITNFSEALKKELENLGFKKAGDILTEKERFILSHDLHSNQYIRIDHPEELKKNMELKRAVIHQLENLKEEEKTMKYDIQNGTDFSTVNYYYHGETSQFQYQIRGGKTTFILKGETVEKETAQETEEVIKEYFKKIYNRQKLKNIFNYPKKHFEDFMHNRFGLSKETREKVYNELTKYYMPKRIEEMLSDNDVKTLNERYQSGSWHQFRYLVLYDIILLIDPKTNEVFSYKTDQLEQANEQFEKIIYQHINQDLLKIKNNVQAFIDSQNS